MSLKNFSGSENIYPEKFLAKVGFSKISQSVFLLPDSLLYSQAKIPPITKA